MSEFANAPNNTRKVIKRFLPKRMLPFLRGVRKRLAKEGYDPNPPFSIVYPFTAASPARCKALYKACTALTDQKIDGDWIECGVLDGGTAAIAAYASKGTGRKLHLFDAWQGLPESTPEDGVEGKSWEADVVGSPRRVQTVMRKVGASPEDIIIHKGWFEETFPKADIPKVSFLHIDCDFHDPVKLCLETWVPRMVSGGYVQIDDYKAFVGCRKAVDDFLVMRPDIELVVEPYGGGAVYFWVP